MSALALLQLGTAAMRLAGGAAAGGQVGATLLRFAPAFQDVGTAAALILWGAATWWLGVAVYSVASTVQRLPFNMG